MTQVVWTEGGSTDASSVGPSGAQLLTGGIASSHARLERLEEVNALAAEEGRQLPERRGGTDHWNPEDALGSAEGIAN